MKMRRAIFAIWFAGLCSAHAQPLSPPTDNPVMKAIVAEDQRVRLASGEKDWTDAGDRERRSQTRRLLASGAIRTGKDFEEAALVFQHGDNPDDFLLAHVLAMTAMARGDRGAAWLACATLDRYLQCIGRKQILGTQYQRLDRDGVMAGDGQWSQEPYDRALVTDDLRATLGVPPQEKQAEQLRVMRAQK